VSDASKIRLVQLYSLRYEKFQGNAVASLIDLLYKNGLSEREISVSLPYFVGRFNFSRWPFADKVILLFLCENSA